ncbi:MULTISPECIES: DUF1330 domain-containing protein [Sphingobium]|jgi:uncharacterized protein (DUF1330 family)|uniref:Uncharacterized conserved protein n=2 Tax=Sphingobium fuliginis (strain ATCC 27551) TaxID=336203 RepID=A0A292ZLU2_SPHSA|nr:MULTISPECIES: DUF1330 domain-containing protein [Sphingobium]OAP30071.1 hypothetical protein A8O16_20535 [Sphingobium sp. 20006FA]AJR23729.1 hypothetical protein TZ53_08360 [Sphingobium sp. YBL2]KXU30516.1 hypothetical protein AXW74_17555 [Sphingobium sp. AM]KYC30775.1 hypothetical protein A0J57_18950 [Sphingobium sp. 22B]MCB4862943.1 DUF1330 domain-containing protein [Sphingobium sp. PNB]
MPAYVVMIRDRLNDAGEMAAYAALAVKARGEKPARRLAFYGEHDAVEGPDPDGVAILEFDDLDAARAWYHSPAYQEALQHRLAGAEYRVILVDGAR